MWAASSPPAPRLRPVALVAALVVAVLTVGIAGAADRVVARHGRPPASLVEHSHVVEVPAGATAQHLVPAPGGRGPSGPAAVTAPFPPTAPDPSTPAAAPPPDPAPAAAAADPGPPAAAALAGLIDSRLADPRLAGTTVGLSVWADGLGEIARNADVPLTPASNQKLFTAMGVLSLLPQTDTLVTEVRATGTQEGRTLTGDLCLVGGGDPTLHS